MDTTQKLQSRVNKIQGKQGDQKNPTRGPKTSKAKQPLSHQYQVPERIIASRKQEGRCLKCGYHGHNIKNCHQGGYRPEPSDPYKAIRKWMINDNLGIIPSPMEVEQDHPLTKENTLLRSQFEEMVQQNISLKSDIEYLELVIKGYKEDEQEYLEAWKKLQLADKPKPASPTLTEKSLSAEEHLEMTRYGLYPEPAYPPARAPTPYKEKEGDQTIKSRYARVEPETLEDWNDKGGDADDEGEYTMEH